MKRFLLLLCASLTLAACQEKKVPVDPVDPVGPSDPTESLEFLPSSFPTVGEVSYSSGADGQLDLGCPSGKVSASIPFKASGAWSTTITSGESWCQVTPASGSGGQSLLLTVTLSANDSYDTRTCSIRITCGAVSRTISVTQAPKLALTLSQSNLEFPAEGGSAEVEIQSNTDFSCEAAQGWIHVQRTRALESHSISVTVDANGNTEPRDGSILVKSEAGDQTLAVRQEGAVPDYFFLEPEEVTLGAEGGDFSVTVSSTRQYHLESVPGWISARTVSGGVHAFTAQANETLSERSGVIVFCDEKGACISCQVRQAAAEPDYFFLEPKEVTLDAEGGDFSVTVTSTRPYQISSYPGWLEPKSDAGEVHVFRVSPNEDFTERSGAIVFCDYNGECISCQVTPAAAEPDYFFLEPKEVTLDAEGGDFSVTVTSTRPYQISSYPGWLEPKSDAGGVHVFTVSPNEDFTERSGVIVFCDNNGECISCQVTQSCTTPYLELDVSLLRFDAEGGQKDILVHTNDNWTATVSGASWFTVSPASFSGDGYLSVMAFGNGYASRRDGMLLIRTAHGLEKQIPIVQEAGSSTLQLSEMSLSFPAEGGQQTVTIRSNDRWTVSSDVLWYSFTPIQGEGDGILSVSAEANDVIDARQGLLTVRTEGGITVTLDIRQDPKEEEFDWSRPFFRRSLVFNFTDNYLIQRPSFAIINNTLRHYAGKVELVNVIVRNALATPASRSLYSQYATSGLVCLIDGRRSYMEFDYLNTEETTPVFAPLLTRCVSESDSYYPAGTVAGFTSAINDGSLNVDLKLFVKTPGSYKLTVFVLEDGVNGQYDHMFRSALSQVTGDPFTVEAGNTQKTFHYSTYVNPAWQQDRLWIFVLVQKTFGNGPRLVDEGFDGGGYYVDNCATGKVGSTVAPTFAGSSGGGGNDDYTPGEPIDW